VHIDGGSAAKPDAVSSFGTADALEEHMRDAGSLWELIELRAEETPDAQMAVDERGATMTFAELRDRAERVAAGLAAKGVGEGTVVSWQLPTWIESMVLVGALARLQAVQNPILHIYRDREVGFIVRQAGSRLLLVPSQFRGFDFESMAYTLVDGTDTEVMIVDRALPEGDPSTLPPPPPTTSAEDAPVRWLFYTSGTTSDPKGAQHTDHTIAATARGMCERLELMADDRNALAFPFTHIGGIIWMFSGLMEGFANILMEAFDPIGTVEVLQREGVTLAGSGTPFHMAYLAAQRKNPDQPLFPDVRVFPGGGAPKPPQLHHDIKREIGGVGIASGYGLTEAPILTMSSVRDDDEALANTEGTPMPGVQLRVVSLDGHEVAAGGEGEIRAKAPQMMRGYLDASLDGDAFDADGWFRTGDLGRIDDGGNVVITGRLKDVIIRKGENISAKEVEDILFGHPAIADVAVIGLPDPEVGERCCAIVVAKEGLQAPTFSDLQAFLAEKGLMKQKWPEQLEVLDVLPRNPAGKVLKKDLREQYARA
jgi:acyl-CoA synthetase (AMP-forming)/AMP-acid ligase II